MPQGVESNEDHTGVRLSSEPIVAVAQDSISGIGAVQADGSQSPALDLAPLGRFWPRPTNTSGAEGRLGTLRDLGQHSDNSNKSGEAEQQKSELIKYLR